MMLGHVEPVSCAKTTKLTMKLHWICFFFNIQWAAAIIMIFHHVCFFSPNKLPFNALIELAVEILKVNPLCNIMVIMTPKTINRPEVNVAKNDISYRIMCSTEIIITLNVNMQKFVQKMKMGGIIWNILAKHKNCKLPTYDYKKTKIYGKWNYVSKQKEYHSSKSL